jgi:N6-adenosine-specific RNA methylase IME4
MSEFRVLYADPPWKFGDKLPGPGRGAEKHYDVLTVQDIMRFPLPPLASDAHLFLWRVASMAEEAYQVVRAWGFVPKAEVVWLKRTVNGKRWFGMGRQVRMEHESCIIAIRGRPQVKDKAVRSTFEAVASRIHSTKPEEMYGIIERLCDGPYVELFARRRRAGWTCFGDELGEVVDEKNAAVG